MPLIDLGDDVSHGIAAVQTDVANGRTGLWLGKGPAGFVLLAGSRKVQELAGGVLIGVSLTPASLYAMRARIDELLEPHKPKRVEVDGIQIGETPKGE